MVNASPRAADLPVIGFAVALQTALIILGFGVGCVLSRIIAVPTVLIGVTLWLAIPATLETPWVRYLTGVLSAALTFTDDLAPSVLLAPLVLAAGVVAAVLLGSVPVRSRLLRAGVALCCVVAGAVPAQAMVADAGYEAPTVPRTGAQTCDEGAPRICVPEEFADALPQLRAAANKALPNLAEAGVDVPGAVAYVSQDARLEPGDWRMHLERPVSDLRAFNAVATAVIPAFRECPDLPDDHGHPSPGPLAAWLRVSAGMDERDASGVGTVRARREAERVRGLDRVEQRRWFDVQLRALRSCDPKAHAEALP